MSKKRKLKVKIKNKNKNQNIIHIKIDNSKKTKSRSNQNQKQHQPSIPNIIIQSPQTQPDYSNILYQMLQNNEKRHASIPIPTYTQQPIKNTNVTPQFSQTEQSSLNILPSIPNYNYDYSTIASNTPLLSKVPSEESFTNYLYREHSYEEHDDTPISILHGRSEGNENSHQLLNSDMKKEDYDVNDIYNTKKKHKDVMDSIRSREMQKKDHNVNNIGENLQELIIYDNPTGVNEFESIIQNEEPINVEKDDENIKETPEEQRQR